MLWNIVKSQPEIIEEQKNRIKALYDGVVCSLRKSPDSRLRPGVPCSHRSSSQFLRPQVSSITSVLADKIPLLHLKRRMGTQCPCVLSGGAHVVVTTSHYRDSRATVEYYQ